SAVSFEVRDLTTGMFGSWRRSSYERLGTIGDGDGGESGKPARHRAGTVHVLVAIQSAIIVFLLLYTLLTSRIIDGDAICGAQLSPYCEYTTSSVNDDIDADDRDVAPFLEANTLQYTTFTEENHLMQPSPYRGQPTPEIETAWRELWRVPRIQFPESKLSALNKTNIDLYAHAAPQYGGGVLGFINVFHELHCLNLIRQYTYRDSYDYSHVTAFRAPPEIVRGHIDHCIETLRKQLMCTSDLTPLIFLKDASRSTGMKPDFNIQRKCRDYQQIQQWTLQNRAEPEEHDELGHLAD
ncbi:Cyclochlorotine biosynthesis protein O, partial [Pseudocercospora fuligena]